MPIEPAEDQMGAIVALARSAEDAPVVMLNLNRYRERAEYGEDYGGDESTEVSGHEAYARYGAVAQSVLERVGGRILWYAQTQGTVIGDENDRYDEVIAVWYPSRAAFVSLVTDAEIVAAMRHRRAGLARAALIACESGGEPVLSVPGGG